MSRFRHCTSQLWCFASAATMFCSNLIGDAASKMPFCKHKTLGHQCSKSELQLLINQLVILQIILTTLQIRAIKLLFCKSHGFAPRGLELFSGQRLKKKTNTQDKATTAVNKPFCRFWNLWRIWTHLKSFDPARHVNPFHYRCNKSKSRKSKTISSIIVNITKSWNVIFHLPNVSTAAG